MKIQDYKVEINEYGVGTLIVIANGEKEIVGDIGKVEGKSAKEIDEIAKQFLEINDYVISSKQEIITVSTQDQQADLSLIRTEMRKILKVLGNPNTSIKEKKELLDIYQTMCASAKVITDTCKLELVFARLNSSELVKINK